MLEIKLSEVNGVFGIDTLGNTRRALAQITNENDLFVAIAKDNFFYTVTSEYGLSIGVQINKGDVFIGAKNDYNKYGLASVAKQLDIIISELTYNNKFMLVKGV